MRYLNNRVNIHGYQTIKPLMFGIDFSDFIQIQT